MNRVFYGLAMVMVVLLIILGVIASRKTTTKTEPNNNGDSFNTDQLQDAAGKIPVTD